MTSIRFGACKKICIFVLHGQLADLCYRALRKHILPIYLSEMFDLCSAEMYKITFRRYQRVTYRSTSKMDLKGVSDA